jgi:hypothetical protein
VWQCCCSCLAPLRERGGRVDLAAWSGPPEWEPGFRYELAWRFCGATLDDEIASLFCMCYAAIRQSQICFLTKLNVKKFRTVLTIFFVGCADCSYAYDDCATVGSCSILLWSAIRALQSISQCARVSGLLAFHGRLLTTIIRSQSCGPYVASTHTPIAFTRRIRC